jgi:hypothetical protein
VEAKRCNGQDKYYLKSQSSLSKDSTPGMALDVNSRRPYSARPIKKIAEETEHSSNGRKRPGSARPYKLDSESGSILNMTSNHLDLSFSKFNEQKRLESGALARYKINSEPRVADNRFSPGLTGFARVDLHDPITRKQRPHSAKISAQNSHWQEKDDFNKFLRMKKRPASAKQPEKNCSLLDGRLLDCMKYDQLNSNVMARKKGSVSAKEEPGDSAQQSNKLRFNMKKHATCSASVEKKG